MVGGGVYIATKDDPEPMQEEEIQEPEEIPSEAIIEPETTIPEPTIEPIATIPTPEPQPPIQQNQETTMEISAYFQGNTPRRTLTASLPQSFVYSYVPPNDTNPNNVSFGIGSIVNGTTTFSIKIPYDGSWSTYSPAELTTAQNNHYADTYRKLNPQNEWIYMSDMNQSNCVQYNNSFFTPAPAGNLCGNPTFEGIDVRCTGDLTDCDLIFKTLKVL